MPLLLLLGFLLLVDLLVMAGRAVDSRRATDRSDWAGRDPTRWLQHTP
jgi:hypothetical protein